MSSLSTFENTFRCKTPPGCCDRQRVSCDNALSFPGLSSLTLTKPLHNRGSMPLQHSARLPCMHTSRPAALIPMADEPPFQCVGTNLKRTLSLPWRLSAIISHTSVGSDAIEALQERHSMLNEYTCALTSKAPASEGHTLLATRAQDVIGLLYLVTSVGPSHWQLTFLNEPVLERAYSVAYAGQHPDLQTPCIRHIMRLRVM